MTHQAAQKNEKEKKERLFFRDTEHLLSFIFFIVVICVSAWVLKSLNNWMDNPKRAVLSKLILNGDLRFTSEDDIRQAILELGLLDTYIGQNVDDIQREIARLPWLKRVNVHKQWPDKIIVSIEEYNPEFYWNDLFLLDSRANVFTVPLDRIANLNLPKLHGPEDKEKWIVETYHKLSNIDKQLANKSFKTVIYSAIIDERNSWQLIIKPCVLDLCYKNPEMKLILGSEHIEQRYRQFLKLFPEIQKRTDEKERILVADLRYENGIAVKKERTK